MSIVAAIFLLTACGKDSAANNSAGDSPNPAAVGEPQTLEKTIEDAEAYTQPEEVDPDVFEMLKNEFLRVLKEKPERTSAATPSGDAGKVTDLAYDSETDLLTWSYVNLGDYNLSGDVNIADVAEIARYYLADATDGEGDDPYEAWVDGSGDGEVNISDVAPIAKNYLNEVSEYVILTSETAEGEYTEIARVDFADAKTPSRVDSNPIVEAGLSNPARIRRTGQSALQFRDGDKTPSQTGVNFPKIFEASLPESALTYVTVQPADVAGEAGATSNTAKEKKWQIETVDSRGGVGLHTSIAIDSRDNPHISYHDIENGDLKYAYYR